MTQETENQNKDVLTEFKDQYVNSDKFNKIQVPFNEPLMFVEDITGLVLYRKGQFQIQLFICVPNCYIPRHRHPNVDSYELFLYGMNFNHSDQSVIDNDVAVKKNVELGKRNFGKVSIVSGVSEGDLVISEGVSKVRDKAKVKIIKPKN